MSFASLIRPVAGGFALIPVLFLITVVAALGGYMATIASAQHATATLAYLGARADSAVHSGVEWAVHRVQAQPADLNCGGSGPSFALADSALSSFTVSINCSAVTVTEGSGIYSVYNLEITAAMGTVGTSDYAARTRTLSVSFPQ